MNSQRQQGSSLEAKTRRAFDASVERLDGATLSRLAQARAAAVNAAQGRHRLPWLGSRGLTGLAAAAALALAIAFLPGRTPAPTDSLTAFDDLDILLEEELELFEELDFYAWLDAQTGADPSADADGSG
jgi:hypothetical protein